MIPSFTLKLIPQLVFGSGKRSVIGEKASLYGKNVLLVTGGTSFQNSLYYRELIESFDKLSLSATTENIRGEPSPEIVDSIVSRHREGEVDVVVAVGGGSALDAGKAISAMLKETGSVTDYLEGVGTKTPGGGKVPFIAVPTTSGTGSEATSNAVISSVGRRGFKKSLRHDNYIPNIAIIDPDLTLSCPGKLTICCGMDCFTQLVEAYLSQKAHPITNTLALQGIEAISRSLLRVAEDGQDISARTDLSYAAFLSGIVLANAGLGTVHGFASVIGGRFPIPHGLVCGSLMEPANRLTLQRLRSAGNNDTALEKYATLGRIFSETAGKSDSFYQDHFITTLGRYVEILGIPDFSGYGINDGAIDQIVAATGNKNNPVELGPDDLKEILSSRC